MDRAAPRHPRIYRVPLPPGSTCHEHETKKKSESPTGIELMTFRIPVGCYNHWDTKALWTHVIHEPCMWSSSPQVLRSSVVRESDRCTQGHRFNSCQGLRVFLCLLLVTCWTHHFSFLHRASNSPYFFIYHMVTVHDCENWSLCILYCM